MKYKKGNYTIPEVCVYFDHKLLRGNRTVKVGPRFAYFVPNLILLKWVWLKTIWKFLNKSKSIFSHNVLRWVRGICTLLTVSTSPHWQRCFFLQWCPYQKYSFSIEQGHQSAPHWETTQRWVLRSQWTTRPSWNRQLCWRWKSIPNFARMWQSSGQ